VEEFVAEQEASIPARLDAVGVDDDLRWADYRRLQSYDRLSLLFCMRDLVRESPFELGALRIEPRGAWRIGVEPYPFADGARTFELVRRLVPKRTWTQRAFREQFLELEPERLEIVVEP
jgi:hypothetical protein